MIAKEEMKAIFFQLVGDMATSGNVIVERTMIQIFSVARVTRKISSFAIAATLECDKQKMKTLLQLSVFFYVGFKNKEENKTN